MVPGDDDGVGSTQHRDSPCPTTGLPGQSGQPSTTPLVKCCVGPVTHGRRSRLGDRREPGEGGREVPSRRGQKSEQIAKQPPVAILLDSEAEFRPRSGEIIPLVPRGKRLQHAPHCRDRRLLVAPHDRQQGLGESHQVPVGNRRLVAVGVAPLLVDRTEHGAGVVGIEKRTRTVVDRLPRYGHVVGIHHAVHEAHVHPLRHERRLLLDNVVEKRHGPIIG